MPTTKIYITYNKDKTVAYPVLSIQWGGSKKPLRIGTGLTVAAKYIKRGSIVRNKSTVDKINLLNRLASSLDDCWEAVKKRNIRERFIDPTPHPEDVKLFYDKMNGKKEEPEKTLSEYILLTNSVLNEAAGGNLPKKGRTALMQTIDKAKAIISGEFSDEMGLSFLGYIEEKIEYWRNTKSAEKKKEGTLDSFKYLAKVLKKYETFTGGVLTFSGVASPDFRDLLLSYLLNVKPPLKSGAIRQYQRTINACINAAIKDKKFGVADIKSINFKVQDSRSTKVWLRSSEIEALFNLEIADRKRSIVRYRFCASYYSGANPVDLNKTETGTYKISRANVKEKDGRYFISYSRQKVARMARKAQRATFEVHPNLFKIFDMFNGVVPDSPYKSGSGTEGQIIRSLCEQIGITDDVVIKHYYPAGPTEEVRRRCDKVALTTARRSAATVKYTELDWPIDEIRKFMGHTGTRQTEEYLLASDVDVVSSRTKNLKLG